MRKRRLNLQAGFTLIEVLLVSSLFLVILTATTLSMTAFERNNRDEQRLNDQAERARRSVERGMRQLRNLASRPTTGLATIARATPDDFIFQTSDPTRTWVRYCRENRTDGSVWLWSLASPLNAAPTSTDCPGAQSAWPKRDPVAQNVTNYAAGRTNNIFTYGRTCLDPTVTACPTALGSITSVRMDLLIDDDLLRKPTDARVSSAVFLRNQNELPTATFVSTAGTGRQVVLNGSNSFDPEGRTLRYFWFVAPAPASFNCVSPPGDEDPTLLGRGVTLTYTLIVCDPGDLRATFTAPVTIR
jgi:prepilin-type N-terminal cleavage/methylation domain-containing protein